MDEAPSKREPIDLAFVIDASASLLPSGFANELSFVAQIIDKLGPVGTDYDSSLRAGVVIYGNTASIRVRFDDYLEHDALKKAIESLPFDNAAETRIDRGFEEAIKLFQQQNGARPATRKVGIFCSLFIDKFVSNADRRKQKKFHSDGRGKRTKASLYLIRTEQIL